MANCFLIMKRPITRLLFACLPVLLCITAMGQQPMAKSLLWRISGKGMNHSSYLYGTIHLQARKLFNFPDSLYAAIDNTEVFSLEINPDSMNVGLSEYMGKIIDEAARDEKENKTKKKEKKLKDILTKEELQTLREHMDDNNNVNPDDLTMKQLYLMKDKIGKHKARKDDMPTFMDAYLYKIARDKGKMMAGLERLEDQLKLLDQLDFSEADPEKVVAFYRNSESAEDKLIDLYMQRDLEELQKLQDILPEKQEKIFLSNRNKIMLRGMDSIMAHHSLFCAVGTLHLPGKLGLINLLREKGYTVEPVICKSYTNGADYKFTRAEDSWVTMTSEKDGYSIKMPGVPSDVDAYGGTVKMKMYIDLAAGRYYISCHVPLPEGSAVPTNELLDKMAEAMTSKSDNVETREITMGEVKGNQYLFKDKDGMYYNLQLIAGKADVYMLMAYAKSAAIKNADSFFHSFKLISKSKTLLKQKVFDNAYISVAVPEYKATTAITYSEDSSQVQHMYTIADPAIGAYYFVVCNQTGKGYNYVNDTIWMDGVKKRFSESGATVMSRDTSVSGSYAQEFETSEFSGMKIKGMLVYRGNRIYKLMVQYPNNATGIADADSFMRSIHLLPVPVRTLHAETGFDGAFSVDVPEPLTAVVKHKKIKNDDTLSDQHILQSFDDSAIITYSVSVKKLSKYYWKSIDTQMLKNWLKKGMEPSDSAPVYTYYKEKGFICGETVSRKKHADQVHKVKVVNDGRTCYVLDCVYPMSIKDSKTIGGFFSSFNILKKETEGLQGSSAQLFADLRSDDTAKRKEALKQTEEVFFSTADIPVLLKEAGSYFKDDTAAGTIFGMSTGGYLMDALKGYADEVTPAQLEQLYNNENVRKRGQQIKVLGMMAAQKDSVTAYKMIKQLLISSRPTKGYIYPLSYEMKKHPYMTLTMYPELLQLLGDSVCGSMVMWRTSALLDSNLLDVNALRAQLPVILAQSKIIREDKHAFGDGTMLKILAKIGGEPLWEEIRKYQYSANVNLRYQAIKMLCDSNISPDAIAIDSMAAHSNYRVEVYNLLSPKDKALFPVRYLTQAAFAEAYMSNYEDEDAAYGHIEPLGMRKETYNGKKQLFYLFKLKGDNTDTAENKTMLGIIGPFAEDGKQLTIDEENKVNGIYSEPLNISNVDNQLKIYLIKKKIEAAPRMKGIDD